jgi:hypothetical protein
MTRLIPLLPKYLTEASITGPSLMNHIISRRHRLSSLLPESAEGEKRDVDSVVFIDSCLWHMAFHKGKIASMIQDSRVA